MKEIQDLIHPLVQSQFPAFYQEEGPLFIEFVKAYFKWLETTNQQLYFSRNLLEYRDIDKTINDFLVHFKETYLKELPLVNESNQRLLVKRALDIYHNKGNQQGVKIALRALYNKDAVVYLPGDDLFKLSNGKWVKPIYLEVSISSRSVSYVNKEIVGTTSGAKAFCEEVVRKRVKGKYLDVLYLSNVRGNFSFREKIVEVSNTNIINAPTVIGSLNELSVVNGGQDFSVGDEFSVISTNGKNAKAIVTSISNETGRVTFRIDDGGWGFSNTANVYISDKVLRFSNLTNSNTSITNFQRFETVTQNLMSVGFTSAVNSNIYTPNTIIFAQGNTTVANATAGIVSVTLVSNTEGIIRVTNLSGNIAATNSTIKASLVNLVFDTSSNISLFANGLSIEAVNATANANAYIITATSSNSTHGTLLLRPINGNVYSTNTSFRLLSNIATIATVNTYSSNLFFTAIIANNSNITANGILIGQNSNHIGLDSVINVFYPNTIHSYVRGLTSNSYANFEFVSTGSSANFKIGSLDNTETVLLNPDLLSSNNTGNVPFLGINLDLSPDNANASGGFGFVKFPGADINTTLLDALRFTNFTIGEISSLASINPGSEYNINPFVLVYEPDVAGYKRKDFIINISNTSGSFTVGERIEQTSNSSAVVLTVNTFSGTAANGTSTTNFEVGEFVYQSNGTANIAAGFVYSSSLSGGAGDVKLRDITGTFQVTPTNGYLLNTLTTGATANISAVNTATTIATSAYGEIKAGSNTSVLLVKRISFGSTFAVGNTVIGLTSGANAVIAVINEQVNSLPIGENANITANVQVANAVVSGLSVIDSGYGYLDGENVTLEKSGSVYIVTAQTNLVKQGQGEGYYRDSGGFVSSDKKLIDSDYYQEYSYEIQTKVPFSKYYEVLNKLVHVAGSKMFGKVVINSFANSQVNSANSVSRLITLNVTNGSNSTFSNSEFVVFSNGNSNSTIHKVTSNNISLGINEGSNVIVIEVPDSNNSFVVGRLVYMPNYSSYVVSGNVVAKNSNTSANVTLLYVTNATGTFTSSNTISGHVSSNIANTSTTTTTLSHAVEVFGYGNVHVPTISTISIPVTNTLSSSLTGTVSVINNSISVVGTGTSFTTNFANNDWIEFTSGASKDLKQIKTVTNTSHIVLRSYPSFTNSVSTFKKSYTFISNTIVKMANVSSNVASGNIFSYEANSTFFTYYLNGVYGTFKGANTVEGYINSTTTNTYTLSSAINTIVVANTENDIPHHSIITGIISNSHANVSYVTVRYEK